MAMINRKQIAPGQEVMIEKANILLLSQADIREAWHVLYLAEHNETDDMKMKSALKQVADGLWAISNHYGADAIGSYEVLTEYDLWPKAQS